MKTTAYNYTGLFRTGPNPSLNACVGANGGPYDFPAYGDGFFAPPSIDRGSSDGWASIAKRLF